MEMTVKLESLDMKSLSFKCLHVLETIEWE
jgi:hypothetical protein